MKMEVLSVQNQLQGQFGVIGSTKVKDWTSPLTPPPLPPQRGNQQQTQKQHSNKSLQQAQQQRQQQQPVQQKEQQDFGLESGGDVVDGRQTTNHYQHYYHRNQHLYPNHNHYHQYHQQQQPAPPPPPPQLQPQPQQPQQQVQYQSKDGIMQAATATAAVESAATTNGSRYAYNNNLLCCEPAQAVDDAGTPTSVPYYGAASGDDIDSAAVSELSQRLQAVLRAAKSQHLACTEVSLPWDLTSRIAAEIIKSSEREPCGVRGCTIFVEFEDEPNNTRRIASLKVDPNTVSTFELYLTLKQDRSGWTSLLPQFLKNLTRSSTILISPDFTLTKNKLYAFE